MYRISTGIQSHAVILTIRPAFERRLWSLSACERAAATVCQQHGAAPTTPLLGSSCYLPDRDSRECDACGATRERANRGYVAGGVDASVRHGVFPPPPGRLATSFQQGFPCVGPPAALVPSRIAGPQQEQPFVPLFAPVRPIAAGRAARRLQGPALPSRGRRTTNTGYNDETAKCARNAVHASDATTNPAPGVSGGTHNPSGGRKATTLPRQRHVKQR